MFLFLFVSFVTLLKAEFPCFESWATKFRCPTVPQDLTNEPDYDAISAAVVELMHAHDAQPDHFSGDFAGCVVRSVGHDFMDRDPTAPVGQMGGMDGCINVCDPDNTGLDDCLAGDFGLLSSTLSEPLGVSVWHDHCATTSLPDFLVIAAEAVMAASAEPENQSFLADSFKEFFLWGREPVLDCEWAGGRLPNPENGCPANKQTFGNRLGLDWRETATLMGVHTLGRAEIKNSGYEGAWSRSKGTFDNDFYIQLKQKSWCPNLAMDGKADKNQWRIGTSEEIDSDGVVDFMLSTDMCLLFEVDSLGDDDFNGLNLKEQPSDHSCCFWSGGVAQQSSSGAGTGFCPVCNNPQDLPEFINPIPEADDNEQHGCQFTSMASGNKVEGKAKQAVKDFASNGMTWLSEFVPVWNKVTNQAPGDLQPLSTTPAPQAAELIVTSEPTASPTDAPTASPTDAPTASPTDAPTASPTDAPTASPTDAPTASPTDAPTASPTDAPTASPTDAPTASPTDAPTASPTDTPTDVQTPPPGFPIGGDCVHCPNSDEDEEPTFAPAPPMAPEPRPQERDLPPTVDCDAMPVFCPLCFSEVVHTGQVFNNCNEEANAQCAPFVDICFTPPTSAPEPVTSAPAPPTFVPVLTTAEPTNEPTDAPTAAKTSEDESSKPALCERPRHWMCPVCDDASVGTLFKFPVTCTDAIRASCNLYDTECASTTRVRNTATSTASSPTVAPHTCTCDEHVMSPKPKKSGPRKHGSMSPHRHGLNPLLRNRRGGPKHDKGHAKGPHAKQSKGFTCTDGTRGLCPGLSVCSSSSNRFLKSQAPLQCQFAGPSRHRLEGQADRPTPYRGNMYTQ